MSILIYVERWSDVTGDRIGMNRLLESSRQIRYCRDERRHTIRIHIKRVKETVVQEQACSNTLRWLARLLYPFVWCALSENQLGRGRTEPAFQHFKERDAIEIRWASININHILCDDVSTAEVGTRILGQFVELFEESAPRMKGAQPTETGASLGPSAASRVLQLILGADSRIPDRRQVHTNASV